jgi:site-specific DNA-adenine methylase
LRNYPNGAKAKNVTLSCDQPIRLRCRVPQELRVLSILTDAALTAYIEQIGRVVLMYLKKAILVSGDFTKALQQVKSGDFVYMDPPFSITTHRMFNEYDATSFDAEQLKQLRREMEQLAERKIKFLVSYANSAEAKVLRKGFKSKTVAVRRNISGFAAARKQSAELLIWNY